MLHPHTSCSQEVLRKFLNGIRYSYRLYVLLHFIPLLIKCGKSQNKLETFKSRILKTLKKFAGSLVFMGLLVANIKAAICVNGHMKPYTFESSINLN